MEKYNIQFTPKAQRDILSILDYISIDLCNSSAALSLLDKITSQIDSLANFPLLGEVFNNDLPLKYEYRRLLADNYLIFYTVNEDSQTIYIMHVVYGSSDYLSILK